MKKLADILAGHDNELRNQWNTTEAAGEFAPIPAGTYKCHVAAVELFNAKTGTPGVKIMFDVCDGEFIGRRIFHDLWLTPAALPQTKRDCAKLGLDTLDKLESANVPPGCIKCDVKVTLRRSDDGAEYNRVQRFDVVSVDEPQADPFAPSEPAEPTPTQPAGKAEGSDDVSN